MSLPVFLRDERKREALLWIAIPAVSFAWFWIFRTETWTGGDSEQYSREIAQGIWIRKRQMLTFAALQATYQIFHPLLGWTADLVFNFVSCVSGAISALIAWRILRREPGGAWPLILFMTAPFTTLFYGHVETYASPTAALLLHLLAIQRSREGAWPIWPIAATFLLFSLCHLVALFLIPSVVVIMALEFRRRRISPRDFYASIPFAAAVPLFWWTLLASNLGAGEMVGGATVHSIRAIILRPWIAFDQPFWRDKLWFFQANTALSAPFMLLAFWTGRRDRLANYWLLHFLCFLNFFVIWCPYQGVLDWDLFSFPWIVGSLALARELMRWRWRAVAAGIVLGGSLASFAIRPLTFSNFARHGTGTITFESVPDPPNPELIRALIDDRVLLESVNERLKPGGHIVTIFQRGCRAQRRVVIVEEGKTIRLRLQGSELRLVD